MTRYSSTSQHYEREAQRYDKRWRRYNERALSAALEALTLSSGDRLLDVGCGTGELERLALQRAPDLQIAGLDITPAMAASAQEKFSGVSGVKFYVGCAEALPFDAGRFDAVVSANMLHHVQQPQAMLKECLRVLRPGGQLVIVDWCLDFRRSRLLDWWSQLTDQSYVRMYRMQELQRLLHGFGGIVRQATRFVAPPHYGMMCLKVLKGSMPA